MKTFYLHFGEDGRLFIDDHPHEKCEVVKETSAETWRQAKEILTA